VRTPRPEETPMTRRRPLGPGYNPDHQDVAAPRRRGRTVAEQAALTAEPPAAPSRSAQTWEERQQDISRIDAVLEFLVAGEDGPVVMLGQDYRRPTDRPRPATLEKVVMAEDYYGQPTERPRRPLVLRTPGDQAPSAG
ncbi:hypothetical protein, partial [Kitasatospora sp. MBT63]|uniref:hypothetical protein n=1 Tax=Kitasatospora sp. MBT63 TaxID=1444768 RepID=UPI0019D71822